ncbi:hypothetical protein V2J09_009842 [Rumex salicifolius]
MEQTHRNTLRKLKSSLKIKILKTINFENIEITALIDVLHYILGGELGALILISGGAALSLAVKKRLAILVELELGDDDLGRIDADVNGRSVNLLPSDALDVDNPFLTVDLCNLAFTSLEGSSDDLNLVVLANGN